MKNNSPEALHLGCGRVYRVGYVNLDVCDPTVADVLADTLRLPFPAHAFRSVRADQLVEHLGWGEMPYFLAECFRVLAPGGSLVLETPDPEASFRRFLDTEDEAEKEAILAWILGRPSPGYSHRWLYEPSYLERALREAGFQEIRFKEPETHRYAPGLRASAARPASPLHEAISELRLAVPRASIIDQDDAREIEARFFCNLPATVHPAGEDARRSFHESALLSPALTARWVQLLLQRGIWSGVEAETTARFLDGLVRAGLGDLLDRAFVQLCEQRNTVSDGYDHIWDRAIEALTECGAGEREITRRNLALALGLRPEVSGAAGTAEGPQCRDNLDPRAVSCGASPGRSERVLPPIADAGRPLFTRARLERQVSGWRDRGIRMLMLGRLREAEDLLLRAFNAKLRHLYTAWNLAVLRTIQGDTATAAAYYRVALRFESPGPEPELRRALALCLLADDERGEARAEIERMPPGRARGELEDVLARLDAGDEVEVPPPPTDAVPAGKGIWL